MRFLPLLVLAGCAAFDCAEWTEPDPGPDPAPRPDDLLSRIDLRRDTLAGEWAVDKGALVARRGPAALRLPSGGAFTLVLAADRPLSARLVRQGSAVDIPLGPDRPRTLTWSDHPRLDGERVVPAKAEGPDSLSTPTPGLAIRTLAGSME